MLLEQCGRKSEPRNLQRAWAWQLAVLPCAPAAAVWGCWPPESAAFCQRAVCVTAPAVASAVPVNNQEMFHKLLRTVSTLDLLTACSRSICSRRLHLFHRVAWPGALCGRALALQRAHLCLTLGVSTR